MIETDKIRGDSRRQKHTEKSRKRQRRSKRFWEMNKAVPSTRTYNLTICDEPKFIWFRNAKVATRTTFSLIEQAGIKCTAESVYNSYYFPQHYVDHFKFAFVRNPWDRLVSGWIDKVVRKNVLDLPEDVHTRCQSFDQFVEYLADANLDLDTGNSHFRRQNKLIDLNEVDYVGRLEKFDKSIYEVFNHLGIPLKDVPIKNGSKKRRHYSTYYTSRSRELIYSMYRKDCELFGYSFEEDRG